MVPIEARRASEPRSPPSISCPRSPLSSSNFNAVLLAADSSLLPRSCQWLTPHLLTVRVEYDYAGSASISRGRIYTGWIRSLAGCTALRAAVLATPEIVATSNADLPPDGTVSSMLAERSSEPEQP